MSEETTRAETDRAREVVGAFQNPEALEAAVDSLEVSGFDRAALSVLATDAKAKAQIDRFYHTLGAPEVAEHIFLVMTSRLVRTLVATSTVTSVVYVVTS